MNYAKGRGKGMLVVAKDGSGDFTNVQDAINSIDDNNKERVFIYIKKGIYKQKLYIEKPFVTLIGEDPENTVLTFDDGANKLLENGEKMGTFRSYSTFIGGDGFIAENITFENSAGSGKIAGQALAAYVDADRVIFKNCRFLGHQDTLFTGPLPHETNIPGSFKGPREYAERRHVRQYYENCTIVGDVDFIFGSATAVFNKCEIVSLDRQSEVNGYITAASTPKEQEYGYVFLNCRLMGDMEPRTVYLGRPWRDYANVAFINCWMDKHIKEEGWHNWNREEREKTARYFEYNSMGPGGITGKRVKWSRILTPEEAKKYTIENVLAENDGWNPLEELNEIEKVFSNRLTK